MPARCSTATSVQLLTPARLKDHYNINLADADEYPSTVTIHGRCVSMIADLWNAPKEFTPDGKEIRALGTATTGSSEGIMLGALALKKRWQQRRKAAGKPHDSPNLIVGANTQVCVEKAAKYFDIELRLVPVSVESRYRLDTAKAIEMADENTIAIYVIAGSTYTGAIEPVKEMSDRLDALENDTGIDIPIHVDAASGGFVLPFAWPELEWDFRARRVASINASGHKYGLAPCGLGWVIWRTPEYLPNDLLFSIDYLGTAGGAIDFNLNFSRPAAPMLVQYFNFIQLGRKGYREIVSADLRNARMFARALENSGYYQVVSEVHHLNPDGAETHPDPTHPGHYMPALPVVAFKWTQDFEAQYPHLRGKQVWVQTLLRARGWIVPNYGLPKPLHDTQILRVVIRQATTSDLIATLVEDILDLTDTIIHEFAAADLGAAAAAAAAVIAGRSTAADNHLAVPAATSTAFPASGRSSSARGSRSPSPSGTRKHKHSHNHGRRKNRNMYHPAISQPDLAAQPAEGFGRTC